LEGFLIPFEAETVAGDGKTLAGVLPRGLVQTADGRETGVAVESVGVGDEGPEAFRT
jgi:hypothetical protein